MVEKLKRMSFEIKRITSGPKHHLFGFHDLVQTNAKGDLALSLEVDDISHPPLPGETCWSGVVPAEGGKFIPIHKTHTWNYPQGARQQWIGDSDLYLCNDRADDGRLICRVVDARKCQIVKTLPFPVHCLDASCRYAYFINYDRLYSLGAYGYTPFCDTEKHRVEDIPTDDGIFRGNLETGEIELLLSIRDIAAAGERSPKKVGYPHFLSHLEVNPSGTRVSCLHQYRVQDGGDIARLVTFGCDGRDVHVLCKGEVSHYTWVDDNHLAFYGGDMAAMAAKRELWIWNLPAARLILPSIKWLVKRIRNEKAAAPTHGSGGCGKMGLQVVEDSTVHEMHNAAPGIIIEDGHPMTNPVWRDWIVMDTYPGKRDFRKLFLYNLKSSEIVSLGEYPMSLKTVDKTKFDLRKVYYGVDGRIKKAFNESQYLHFRSGLHCDLHPRWGHDGRIVFFDSIHEADERQLYAIDVGSVVCR